ncbi:glycosyltransferase [Halostella sp. JP-L12]|uniref:glycosyltransferase n=1 Tax=Halostella TaxID=1843185 RepID=UPI000EF8275F|nr:MULTISPECIES: glycosyltransferase [Halostella]NHN46467.1 glycosyltransferase [Halostella sp. JP-L12]
MPPQHAIDGSLSVVLPTRRWTRACDELVEQLAPGEEFIVACDRPDDPVVAAAAATPAEVVVAGEPRRCSAKCNALAAGLERATGEYLVCTDADFAHGPEWLATVRDHLAEAPAGHVVSSAPVVVSKRPLSALLEGPTAVGAALTVLLETTAWGGTMAFRRDALDLDAYIADLRRTMSDDALLTQRVDGVHSVPELVRPMPVAGTCAETLDRQVRWTRTGLYLDPVGLVMFAAVLPLLVLCGTILAPILTIPLVTIVTGLAYAYCGLHRWTFLLAVPGYIVSLPLLLYGLARSEFDWNGRRYRWTALYDVTVLDHGDARLDR